MSEYSDVGLHKFHSTLNFFAFFFILTNILQLYPRVFFYIQSIYIFGQVYY
jgi:hypothetical protein